MASRAPKFTTAAMTQPTADSPPVSEIPSKEPRNNGQSAHEDDYSLDALIGGRPDPDLDLIPKNYAIPRYVAEALRMENVRTKTPIQALVTQALKEYLPPALLGACLRKAKQGQS